jgi:hypothetical protein
VHKIKETVTVNAKPKKAGKEYEWEISIKPSDDRVNAHFIHHVDISGNIRDAQIC